MEEARGNRHRYFKVDEATVTTAVSGEVPPSVEQVEERSYARLSIRVGDKQGNETAHGNGPVHALGTAFRQLLQQHYPSVADVRLTDYKVRILNSGMGMASTVRVLIRASDGYESWGTVGVSTNVVEASWRALVDSFEYKLAKDGVTPTERMSVVVGEEQVSCPV